MTQLRLHWHLWATVTVAFVCATLLISSCGKQGAGGSSPAAKPAGAPANTSAPAANAGKPQSATPQSEDSDEANDGPEIPGTIDGAPAMMSEDAFLSAYREVDGVIALNDGLMYRVITTGKGKSPTLSDSVRVSYKGTLMDGSVFDQTKPGETLTLQLARTIPGWREALPMMKEGDKWEVVIPSALAYGEAGAPPAVPPNAPLVFEITLVEVVKS
jgi:FKBP-type peptidyl-prolyl cis-trans isomerase